MAFADILHVGVELDESLHRGPAEARGDSHIERLVGDLRDRGNGREEAAVRCVGGFSIGGVLGVDEVLAEGNRAVAGMRDGHLDVGTTHGHESIPRVVDTVAGRAHRGVKVLQRVDRDGGEQAGRVTEVMCGRGVRDAGASGHFAERESRSAAFGNEVGGNEAQLLGEVAVVVALLGHPFHCAMRKNILTVTRRYLYSGNMHMSAPSEISQKVERRRWSILAVSCLAVFVTLLDGTIVNIALPSLSRDLGASTRQLQWIVDAYLLVFTGLLLAAGGLGDRFGRKRSLIFGLIAFGVTSVIAGSAGSAGALILSRALMGIGAAFIFPATLAILASVFTDPKERAAAIGVWAATSGVAVAAGPIVGGWLLENYWWGSVFYINVPIVIIAVTASMILIPESRDATAPKLDVGGVLLSIGAITALVFTIIEAPEWGWASGQTAVGFGIAVVALAAFVGWELRISSPMLPVRIFTNLRFSAASIAVTSAFFALFGFIFLVTQYFQLVRGYGPLEAGVRTVPVATSIAVAAVLAPKVVERFGTKRVVTIGLAMMGVGFLWISTVSEATSYVEIVGQMFFLGVGLGLTTAPATESIMGSLSADKAGIGSAVNDTTRELGGTLGVAIIGSVFSSVYVAALDDSELIAQLPPDVRHLTEESVGAAGFVAQGLGDGAPAYLTAVNEAFLSGMSTACLVAAVVALSGAAFAARFLPARAEDVDVREIPELVSA